MSAFWNKAKPAEPETVEPFTRWSILTHLETGQTMTLSSFVYSEFDQAEMLRYVDAVADGLRAAGFSAEVTLTREAEVRR